MTNFTPDAKVMASMNDIYAQTLGKQVSATVADTNKMVQVILAEAESTRKELLGKGVSLMRQAYLDGVQSSLDEFVQVRDTLTDEHLEGARCGARHRACGSLAK